MRSHGNCLPQAAERELSPQALITANTTQHELVQEAAERQRAEDKAGKQLERVQAQMEEFIGGCLSFASRSCIFYV